MAQREAKFDWPCDQFLRFRVQWPSERRVKFENGKLKRREPVGIRILPETKQGYLARIKRAQREWVERQRQRLPTVCGRRKRWGIRKLKGRTKTSQLQDELPEWVHRRRGEISKGKPAAAGEKVGHPPSLPFTQLMSNGVN
jgi:hypothetical protein